MNAVPTSLFERRGVLWALYLGFWTSLGLFNVGQSYMRHQWEGEPMNWPYALSIGWADWSMWALLTPLIVVLGRNFPLDQKHWPFSLLLHGAVSILCAALVTMTLVPVILWFAPCGDPDITTLELFRFVFLGQVVAYLWIYWAVLIAGYAFDFYRKYREHALHASRLETQLAQTQLQMLKMQLQPHFLFNTLNAISALMHRDVELADRMVARLGELLRSTLENTGTQEVTLRQELDFIQPYLEIEQARYGPRMRVRIEVDDSVMDALVPNMILQPLVENAIRHGIGNRTNGGLIVVRAFRVADLLELQVCDNGPGIPDGTDGIREGVGLANTRARLLQLYGQEQHLELHNAPEGGLVVRLALPFREFAGAESEVRPSTSRESPTLTGSHS